MVFILLYINLFFFCFFFKNESILLKEFRVNKFVIRSWFVLGKDFIVDGSFFILIGDFIFEVLLVVVVGVIILEGVLGVVIIIVVGVDEYRVGIVLVIICFGLFIIELFFVLIFI